jgi:hypothetical protein
LSRLEQHNPRNTTSPTRDPPRIQLDHWDKSVYTVWAIWQPLTFGLFGLSVLIKVAARTSRSRHLVKFKELTNPLQLAENDKVGEMAEWLKATVC